MSWDHLGSVRLVTDANANVIGRHDYLPFGEEIPASTAGRDQTFGPANDNVAQKFTGQYRDPESGEDFFHARYFSGVLGRFASPDPGNAGADLMNPQSWNAYSYVGNNPLAVTDPSGLDWWDCGDDPFCGWWPPTVPPCVFFGCGGGGGGGTSGGGGTGSSPTPTSTSIPPNSFPGGETLGLPPGLHTPLPSPAVLLGLGLNMNCEFGVCINSVADGDSAEWQIVLSNTADVIAGAGDAISFGFSAWFRRKMAGKDPRSCSGYYKTGSWIGVGLSTAPVPPRALRKLA